MWSSIFTTGFLVSLLAATIRLATPILFAAMGEIYTQRSEYSTLVWRER